MNAAHAEANANRTEVVVNAHDVPLAGTLTVPEGAEGIVLFAHGSGSSRFSPRNVFYKARPLENVHGEDVYVMQSLYGEPGLSANDKLCRLLFFIGALKDASAQRVTAVLPYLCYARKDRRSKTRDRAARSPICWIAMQLHEP
jgi:hypothetical protein